MKVPWWAFIGGLLGVPSGFLLGQYLVDSFGRSMLAGLRWQHRSALHARLDRGRSSRGDRLRSPRDVRACRQVDPRRAVGFDGEHRRSSARQDDPHVAAGRWGQVLLAAAVVLLKIFERGSLPLSMGINGLTVALCGVVLVTVWIAPRAAGLSSRSADESSARRRAPAGRRCAALHAAVRTVRRATGREHQSGHRLDSMQLLGTDTDCGAEGRPTARRLVDQRAVGARSARRPDIRRHVTIW